MGNALYAQAIGVILLFAFLFFVVLSAKGWRWHHVTTLVLIFFSAIFFVVMASSVLKTHSVWRTRYQQTAQELEQEQAQGEVLKFGPLTNAAEDAESLLRLQNELNRVIVDRGRVWRDVELTGAQGNQITFKFPDRNVAGVDTAPPVHRLQPNTILYGFKEKENPDAWKVPAFYMGEFVVQSVTPDTVVVTPSQPMDNFQTAEVRPDGVTWALYEVMPNDAHYKFEQLADDELRELLMPGGWHGRPQMAPPEMYEEMVTQYQRDKNQDPATADDPPERTWMEVELTQAWKVDVDAPAAGTQLPTRHFDVAGLAVTPHLRAGAASEFEPGDKVLVDSETAEKLISQGIARRGPIVYRRELRDYAYAYDEVNRRLRVLDEGIRLVTKANDTVQQAIDKANTQITYRQDEKTKLAEDQQHIHQERDAMTQYRSTLEGQKKALYANLSALFRQNNELVDRLRRIEQAIVQAVQQQLAEAGN